MNRCRKREADNPACAAQLAAVTNRIEAEHAHLSGVGPAVTLEDLDGGGLARAVRPEQSEHFARADFEVELVDRACEAV